MGMNMVSKGVQNVLDFLQNDFPDMDVIGISGMCLVIYLEVVVIFYFLSLMKFGFIL